MSPSREFLEVLDLYLAELPPDPCFEQARAYYADGRSPAPRLDGRGSPVEQLRADARAGGAFLQETAEAIARAPVLVWYPGGARPGRRYRPDRFAEAAARVVGALSPAPAGPVVVTLDGGVRSRGVCRGLDGAAGALVASWRRDYAAELERYRAECRRTGVKGYKELSLFTLVGFAGGLGLGALLDALGFSTSAIGEWAVRTLSGEGEDLSEGAWVLRRRLGRRGATAGATAEDEARPGPPERDEHPAAGEGDEEEGLVWFEGGDEGEAAEAYGTGKIVGMAFPWAVDLVSRLAGVDVRAPEGTYVAYLYSLADQVFATVNGFRYHVRRAGSFGGGLRGYTRDPVMVASFTVVTLPFLALYLVRAGGWRPDTLFLAAVEAVLLNLCWVPPLAAWIWDRRLQRGLRRVTEGYAARAAAGCVRPAP